ncbi:hypothetical protein LEP1GSC017_2150 [Leptospira meyeri serovar Hardjo str. Went 5]|nr:hypothetical protein LEP1GSC017_2150 [Leptospira meyeri serovar Hardjo str. Went 5]
MVVEWFWNLMKTIRGSFLFTTEKSTLHLTKTKPQNPEVKSNLRYRSPITCGSLTEPLDSLRLKGESIHKSLGLKSSAGSKSLDPS